MTDLQFSRLLTKLTRAHAKYLDLLQQAEEEYKHRWGHYPSEVDDDHWIDSFHQSCSGSSLDAVKERAEFIINMR